MASTPGCLARGTLRQARVPHAFASKHADNRRTINIFRVQTHAVCACCITVCQRPPCNTLAAHSHQLILRLAVAKPFSTVYFLWMVRQSGNASGRIRISSAPDFDSAVRAACNKRTTLLRSDLQLLCCSTLSAAKCGSQRLTVIAHQK